MITATWGYTSLNGKQVLISFWPSNAGELPNGDFDIDAWEESESTIAMVEGACPRAAWREAFRHVRKVARESGGLEWMDCKVLPDDPCPFPDRSRGTDLCNRI